MHVQKKRERDREIEGEREREREIEGEREMQTCISKSVVVVIRDRLRGVDPHQ